MQREGVRQIERRSSSFPSHQFAQLVLSGLEGSSQLLQKRCWLPYRKIHPKSFHNPYSRYPCSQSKSQIEDYIKHGWQFQPLCSWAWLLLLPSLSHLHPPICSCFISCHPTQIITLLSQSSSISFLLPLQLLSLPSHLPLPFPGCHIPSSLSSFSHHKSFPSLLCLVSPHQQLWQYRNREHDHKASSTCWLYYKSAPCPNRAEMWPSVSLVWHYIALSSPIKHTYNLGSTGIDKRSLI